MVLSWAVLMGQILRGELDALRDHWRKYHWATFRDLFDNFLDQVAALPHARRNNLIHAAQQHCVDWDDTFLAKLQFDEFVEVLAGARKAQPVLLRIPLLHWLTVWAADRDGSAVACPKIQSHDPPGKEVGKIRAPSPLGKAEWELELQRRVDDKSLLTLDAIVALRAKEAPGSEAAPTWLSMLDAPLDVDDEGLEQQLESLANLTDTAAAHAARSLHALARPHAVPARPLQALQSAVFGATLAAAAQSAWAACPTFNRPAMRQELTKFLETVASRFGSNLRAPDANHQTLQDVQQLLVQAERDGVTNWRAVAINFFKDGDLPVAFTNCFAPVRDLRGLRQALGDGVEHHLVSPGERRQALVVLKRSLASRLSQRDRATADWFLAGALQPTDHLPAFPQCQVAHTTSAAGMAASATVGFQPVSPNSATRAVRISHLGRVNATELSSVMSHALGVPIFITAADHSRGFGFAAVPEAKCAEIFLGEFVAQREYVVAPGKSVTLAWRSATTNEPFALATLRALTTPPS